jgi:hypothetical protein
MYTWSPYDCFDQTSGTVAMRKKYDAFWDRFRGSKGGVIEPGDDGRCSGESSSSTSQLFHGRNIIVNSVCPQLCGMFFVKLSLLLTLVGGTHPNLNGNEGSHKASG